MSKIPLEQLYGVWVEAIEAWIKQPTKKNLTLERAAWDKLMEHAMGLS